MPYSCPTRLPPELSQAGPSHEIVVMEHLRRTPVRQFVLTPSWRRQQPTSG
jgi:hypothetical protein